MTKKRVYIAGKVSGTPLAECTMKFGTAQKRLEAEGYEVVNPLEVVTSNSELGFKTPWPVAMKLTLAAMMTCDLVYMLEDYRFSRGAMIEHQLAEQILMPIMYEKD